MAVETVVVHVEDVMHLPTKVAKRVLDFRVHRVTALHQRKVEMESV